MFGIPLETIGVVVGGTIFAIIGLAFATMFCALAYAVVRAAIREEL